jgi:hypothetical protein
METPIIFKMNWDVALSHAWHFIGWFCEVRVVWQEMIGQGGGREQGADGVGLHQQWCWFGQGGRREWVMDKIREVSECSFGQGGGCVEVVVYPLEAFS